MEYRCKSHTNKISYREFDLMLRLSMFIWSLYLTEECLFIVDLVIHRYVTAIDCTKDVVEQTGFYIYVSNDNRR